MAGPGGQLTGIHCGKLAWATRSGSRGGSGVTTPSETAAFESTFMGRITDRQAN